MTARAWLLHTGTAGFTVQCQGLADALGVDAETHILNPGPPWRWMAPWGPAGPSQRFRPPWPDIAIGSGRQAVPHLRRMKRQGVFTVFLQNPQVSPSTFDLVWRPAHDRIRHDSVVRTTTPPHGLTFEKLAAAGAAFAGTFAQIPRPRLGVVIGGNNGVFTVGRDEIERLAANLRRLVEARGIGLLVTPSRRTGAENIAILRSALQDLPAFVWDFEGANPYAAILDASDWLLVSCDSVNMVSEATFTGKPAYMLRLPGGSAKFKRFHENVLASGAVRWFDGRLDSWSPTPLNATREIADAVSRAFEEKTGKPLK